MNRYLFVYGTLKPESGLFKDLGIDYDVVGEGHIEGVKVNGTEYPAVIPAMNDKKQLVKGILVKLNKPLIALSILDEYEEYFPNSITKSLYVRDKTQVNLIDGQSEEGWIYWFNEKKSHKINGTKPKTSAVVRLQSRKKRFSKAKNK